MALAQFEFLPSVVEMFLYGTTPALLESVAVASGPRSRASAHAPLAIGSVFQGTGTYTHGYLLPLHFTLDNQGRPDVQRQEKSKLRGLSERL